MRSVLVMAVAVCGAAPPAFACMLVAGKPIAVSGEEALVIWEETSRTEELIRYIDFRGEASEFGFLVPTPSAPSVRVLDSRAVFEVLNRLYRAPERSTRERSRRKGVRLKSAPSKKRVKVVSQV